VRSAALLPPVGQPADEVEAPAVLVLEAVELRLDRAPRRGLLSVLKGEAHAADGTAAGDARALATRTRYSRHEHRQRDPDPQWLSSVLDGDFGALRNLMEPDA
jgi:hypothetical protein